MWVEKRTKGNYKFVEQYKDPLTGKYKRVSVTMDKDTNNTRKKAQIALERKITAKLNKEIDGRIVEGVSLEQLAYEWFAEYKNRVAPSTAYHAKNIMKSILQLFGKDILVAKISAKLITAKYNEYLYGPHPHSNDMTKKSVWKLSQILRYGVIHEYVKEDMAKKAEIEWRNERKVPTSITDKYLTDEEYQKIITYAKEKNKDFADLFQFLYFTGLRCGEATCLLPSDFFEEDGVTYVRVASTLNETGVKIADAKRGEAPKTQNSFRTVSLPRRAAEIYQRRLKDLTHQYLFTNEYAFNHEKIISVKSADAFLKKARIDLKMKKRITTHIFRHTHISKLAELNIPLYIIQRRVGHNDSGITNAVYLHVRKEASREVDSKIINLN